MVEPSLQGRGLDFALAAEHRSRLCWFIGTAPGVQDPAALTYEPYFGLREKPFSLSSDPRFFFTRSSHGPAFDALVAGIRRREGILALTGEVGTGKTTLCRAVVHSLSQKVFAAFVPDPFLSREDFLKTLLVDFGIVSSDDVRAGHLRGASRTDLSYPLYDFLRSLQAVDAMVVVMIDEAQNLTSELLEEIRILSDLEDKQKLLEVLLVGQPELQSRLMRPEMRQLKQRVAVRHELSPLTIDEVAEYVSHRLEIAGNDGRVLFTDHAIETIFLASQGIPRVINLVCDRALWHAAGSRTTMVTGEKAVWAVADLGLGVAEPSRSSSGDADEPAVRWSSADASLAEWVPEPEDVPQPADIDQLSAPAKDGASPVEAASSAQVSAGLRQTPHTDARLDGSVPFIDEDVVPGLRNNWRRLAALGAWLVLALGIRR